MEVFGRTVEPVPGSVSSGDARPPVDARQLVDGRGRSVSTAVLYEVWPAIRALSTGVVSGVWVDRLPALDGDTRAWCRTTGHERLTFGVSNSVPQTPARAACWTMPLRAGASAAAAQLRASSRANGKRALKVGRAALLSRRQRPGTRVSTEQQCGKDPDELESRPA